MKDFGIAVLATITLVILGVSGFIFFTRSADNEVSPSVASVKETNETSAPQSQTSTKPQTLEECYAQSEKSYRDYLNAHAQKKTNSYGQPVYDLPRVEWDKINQKRADEHHICGQKFAS